MNKVLVAYFSATGITGKVAERLASAVEADLFEIVPVTPYTKEDLDWMDKKSRSTVEMKDLLCRPGISSEVEDMSRYTHVFLGFPIWWYREPSIIDTFIESYNFTGITVIPFCTSGGSGLGDTAKNLQELAEEANVVEGKRFTISDKEDVLRAWAEEVLENTDVEEA